MPCIEHRRKRVETGGLSKPCKLVENPLPGIHLPPKKRVADNGGWQAGVFAGFEAGQVHGIDDQDVRCFAGDDFSDFETNGL